jgi:geranylgeranyl diphosphate synthase type II
LPEAGKERALNISTRIEEALLSAVGNCEGSDAPRGLAGAIHHAVFPAGARVRPRLCLAVAAACGDDQPGLSDAAAASIELLHCASLVHDDLPCFDAATTRRGLPTVHCAFGERLAVLAGDALIVLAFETLSRASPVAPGRLPGLLLTVGRAVGAPAGIAAGQAWECEPSVDLALYHRAKTGALFVAAAEAGALAAGADPADWRTLGARLGEAYQVADDIRDVAASEAEVGKPVGRDAALGRPNAATELGLPAAVGHFRRLVAAGIAAIPDCTGRDLLRDLMRHEADRLIPREIARLAA